MDKGIIVVKVGTSTLSRAQGKLDPSFISSFTGQICTLMESGYKVVLVTSGAIGAGMEALGLFKRPKDIAALQACAAIGQGKLMKYYEESFRARGTHAAQILLTLDDFSDRKRFLNAKNTILELLYNMKAVPVINENDTIATEEIRFGDNDKLSAMVANSVGAHTLVLLTDVDGFYSLKDKKLIPIVTHISSEIEKMAKGSKGRLGTGGMRSKLYAAKLVVNSGTTCIIANGSTKDILLKIARKEPVGTIFVPSKMKASSKKKWLMMSPRPKGVVAVDEGARDAIVKAGKSLLAAGVRAVEGEFDSGDVINISTLKGENFAKGMAGFSSTELKKIKGMKTGEIEQALGRKITSNEVVHRDNLVVLE